jgi:antitoxin CcdA
MEAIMAVVQRTTHKAARRATNVSISEGLLVEARTLEVNISRAAEAGLTRAIADRRAELWVAENRAALESSNAYVEQNGLPLAKYRSF